MSDKIPVILLQKGIDSGDSYIKICNQENAPVICMNKDTGVKKRMPFKVMFEHNSRFWLQNKTWEYYIEIHEHEKILELVAEEDEEYKIPEQDPNEEISPDDIIKGFGQDYETIAAVAEPERILLITDGNDRLEKLIEKKPRDEDEITEALVDTVQITMLHNHASLMNAMSLSNEEAKKQTQGLVESTRQFVKTSSQLLSANIFNDDLMKTLVSKSNGTIIQHMIRVYLNGLAFLSYYNKTVSSSSMINKLRASFSTRYRKFYETLLPNLEPDDISLERVFLGGMRAIPDEDFYNWAAGFLMHDLGKAAAVEYHEGEDAYNRDIVIEHVKLGYDSIINKTNYPREVGLIAGYHHEYYGSPGGYGYYRTYLEQVKKNNPKSVQNYCIALELEPVIECEALAFFPAKVLEIIDVFDSVTDPSRKYRKAMTTKEALEMMLKEFIIKEQKIDLILFDIFAKFVSEMTLHQ